MKKSLINVLVVGILILGLGIGLILLRQSQDIRERANTASDILISLSPISTTISGGQKTTINVVLTNETNPAKDLSINTAQVDLQFDTTLFSASNVVCNSGFLSSPSVTTVSGNKISFKCTVPNGSNAKIISTASQTNLGSFDITAGGQTGTSNITVSDAVVPDSTTQTDLSGNTGLGGSYTVVRVGGTVATLTPSPIASATATPMVLLITSPTPIASPAPTPQTLLGQLTSSNIFLIGGIGAIVLSLLIALIIAFGKRGGNPPQINPPAGESNPPVPPTPTPPTPESPTFQQPSSFAPPEPPAAPGPQTPQPQ